MRPLRLSPVLLVATLWCLQSTSDAASIVGHIVPHSHDDVGWLVTLDQYYDAYVRRIYSSVVEALGQAPARRFISVEMAFFSKWWHDTAHVNDTMRAGARQAVERGQLEFVVGGWTMQDEACTTYGANIAQMAHGHAFIDSTFGERARPRRGWQIDPFGASSSCHAHFREMGFESTLLDRVYKPLKEELEQTKQLQFHWTPLHGNNDTRIFTHIMDSHGYPTAVPELAWSRRSEPITDQNIHKRAQSIVDNLVKRQEWFETNQILFPWGDDFAHSRAVLDFDNMDKLVAYINAHSASDFANVTVRYSTLSEFFTALTHSSSRPFPSVPPRDYFPYSDVGNLTFWSGYFTSRPALKRTARQSESFQRTAELTQSISGASSALPALAQLRDACAILTHHDAVAGTAQVLVNRDYFDRVHSAQSAVTPILEQSISSLLNATVPLSLDPNHMKSLSTDSPVTVTVFNPSSWTLTQFISVPLFALPSQSHSVLTVHSLNDSPHSNESPLPTDILPQIPSHPQYCQSPLSCGYPQTNATHSLFFPITIPPLAFRSYRIQLAPSPKSNPLPIVSSSLRSIQNGQIQLNFDPQSNLLMSLTHIEKNWTQNVQQNFFEYEDMGDLHIKKAPGGAYIFHPKGPADALTGQPTLHTVHGQFVSEAHQSFTSHCDDPLLHSHSCGVSQVFRVYRFPSEESRSTVHSESVQILNQMGPLKMQRNIVSRWSLSDFNNGKQVETDDNCFTMLKRPYVNGLPIAGQYHPMTCRVSSTSSNTNRTIALFTDRTRGASALNQEGQIEMMMHRRVVSIDGRGPLDLDDEDRLENMETLFVLNERERVHTQAHVLQYQQQLTPTVLFAEGTHAHAAPYAIIHPNVLPESLHLLTLQQTNETMISERVVRIANVSPDSTDSVDLARLFAFAQVVSVRVRALSVVAPPSTSQSSAVVGTVVTLKPLEITTLIVTFKI